MKKVLDLINRINDHQIELYNQDPTSKDFIMNKLVKTKGEGKLQTIKM
jgi:hypothetical protein